MLGPMAKKDESPAFETILEQLEDQVNSLERGDLALEEALAAFEKGVALARQGDKVLTAAQARVDLLLSVDEDGTAQTRPLDG
ncbi:MAG: exodeoxyribonuclease VII small subunit [Myxococcota bacterium]|jgi:exodeoxyribonuclease VII small subunit